MSIKKTPSRFYSHGKLLITGEYLVLDGAMALAVPTRLGQSMSVEQAPAGRPELIWTSLNLEGETWFSGHFDLPSGRFRTGNDEAVGRRLEQIFAAAKTLAPSLWEDDFPRTYIVRTDLEFPRDWGLGTSSTLIANLARWWEIDAHRLLALTFGGSGYDLACAQAENPLFYRLSDGIPQVRPAHFFPPFHRYLYFLYLEQKQNSRAGIAQYRDRGKPSEAEMERISTLSRQIVLTDNLRTFRELMEEHERIIGALIGCRPVKNRLFPDLSGSVKSLGAWGGDFVLVASEVARKELEVYFSSRGFPTLISFGEMVL